MLKGVVKPSKVFFKAYYNNFLLYLGFKERVILSQLMGNIFRHRSTIIKCLNILKAIVNLSCIYNNGIVIMDEIVLLV